MFKYPHISLEEAIKKGNLKIHLNKEAIQDTAMLHALRYCIKIPSKEEIQDWKETYQSLTDEKYKIVKAWMNKWTILPYGFDKTDDELVQKILQKQDGI